MLALTESVIWTESLVFTAMSKIQRTRYASGVDGDQRRCGRVCGGNQDIQSCCRLNTPVPSPSVESSPAS